MSARALRTIWSFLGVLAFAFALTSALRATGSEVSEYLLPLGSVEPYSAALVSWPILGALIAALLHITSLHATHATISERQSWTERLPVFYFDPPDVDPGSALGARYQGVIAAGFLALPLVIHVVLLLKCFGATTFAPGNALFAQPGEHFWPPLPIDWSAAFVGEYRFGDVEKGVTFYPLLFPYGYVTGELLLLLYSVRVGSLVRGRRRPTPARRRVARR